MLALEALFPSDRMSRRTLRRFLRVPTAQLLVAEDAAGAIVGDLLWLRRKGSGVARIYSVVVVAAARGGRWGERLVLAMEAAAQAAGCRSASLEVRADNAAARALYAKLGYCQARTLPGYYDDGADGLRLVKALAVQLSPGSCSSASVSPNAAVTGRPAS